MIQNQMACSNNDSTVVLLWKPNPPENTFGHVTIQTKHYHMSLWPDGDVKHFGSYNTFIDGMKGSLVYHHNYDRYLEGNIDPEIITIDFVSMKKVEEKYEDVLNYNDITPDTVTLEAGEEKLEGRKKPEISLNTSLYSFNGEFYEQDEFYKYKQSCTTFSMGLLSYADLNGRFNLPLVVQMGKAFADALAVVTSLISFETVKIVGGLKGITSSKATIGLKGVTGILSVEEFGEEILERNNYQRRRLSNRQES